MTTQTPTIYPCLPCPVCQQESITVEVTRASHDTQYDLWKWCDCDFDAAEAIEEYTELGVFQDEEE
jgi:hypothetical protein